MPLPVTFATLTQGNQPLSLLDTQFAAIGTLVTIPCTATGQNSIVLTPLPNTPAFSNYTTLSPSFSFVQQQTTTGAVTIQISGLTPLSAYGSNGGVALGSGDMTAGNTYQCVYNPTLNTGAGGFVVNTFSAVSTQGNWVPLLQGSTVAGTPTYVQQGGSYEQIGRQITARFVVQTSAITGISGNIRIANFPFTNSVETFGAIPVFQGWTSAGYTTLGLEMDPSTTFGRIIKSGSGQLLTDIASGELSASCLFAGSISYHV